MATSPRARRSPTHPLAGLSTGKRRRPDSSSEEEPEDQLPSSSGLPPSSPPPSMRSEDEQVQSDGVITGDEGAVSDGSEGEGEDLFGDQMMEYVLFLPFEQRGRV
ncbi:hypothetical protein BT69DRAFT_395327 [Atractiella rhizophila]|nr:hypothetical protein BT69DRAFT_395327 [Atractiella rhizophila]